MESKYEPKVIENVFKALDNKQSLYLMGLSLASNDLAINHDSLSRYPDNESTYFFLNSISIIRELASLVAEIDKSDLTHIFSKNTNGLFEQLKSELTSFSDNSLVKTVLKPIRDISFHYNFTKSNQTEKIESVLNKLRAESDISIGLTQSKNSPLDQRYIYADWFRAHVTNQFLTTEIVSRISTIAVDVVCFVDSLVTDLVCKLQVK